MFPCLWILHSSLPLLLLANVYQGVIRRGHQKILKGSSEDTQGVIRRYSRGHQKILKGSSEAVTRRRTDNAMVKRKMQKEQTMSNNTLHSKLKIEQHKPH
jgi:hypothetical protein